MEAPSLKLERRLITRELRIVRDWLVDSLGLYNPRLGSFLTLSLVELLGLLGTAESPSHGTARICPFNSYSPRKAIGGKNHLILLK
jgi:hypothetical protein